MAESKFSEQALEPTTASTERPLRIDIRPLKLDFWEFQGSRAQLESEGVIPPGTEWPEGDGDQRWEAGRFRYWLRRCRPDGMKGPKKLWTSGDWWFLRCELLNGPDHATRCILEKKAELVAELYRHSAAGQREWSARWRRYWDTVEDKAFQAFKEKVPVLIPPKRGRKPKAVCGSAT